MKKIKSALISVFYKDGLGEIVDFLAKEGVEIYSTGGTLDFIESRGIKANPVEGLTGYPSILGGRVKTLHPGVFGGILARRDNPTDGEQLTEYNIPEIDLVIVDLYPFEETVKSGAEHQQIIEKIDIGGISLIRAAAKNYKDVVIIPSVKQYGELMELMQAQGAATTVENRLRFAAHAFAVSSSYDSAIFNYFNCEQNLDEIRITHSGGTPLRYGENPHQAAKFYGDIDALFTKLNGKDISYNNMLDIDAAINLIGEFDKTTFAILKHNNACGVATRESVVEAWKDALAGDPVSAFGGVLVCNREIDALAAQEINKLFFEVIIAPSYAPEALETLKSKKNRIILEQKGDGKSPMQMRTLLGGIAAQEPDNKVGGVDTPMECVTSQSVSDAQKEDLIFANKIVKHSKSNAIVLAKGSMLLASGVGQTSRVDALRQAIAKAKSFDFELAGSVLASDAFFPFADCAEIAHAEGIDTIIQPGGSMRDSDTIEYCNANGMAMVMTGMRHFKH